MDITASCRGKPLEQGMDDWLHQFSDLVSSKKINSVFGFSDYSPLYGGRVFTDKEISDEDFKFLKNNGISYRIPMTNHYFSEKDYDYSLSILRKHHLSGNSVICVNDKLAERIKTDFPKYEVEASVIKDIGFAQIDETLKIYDAVVLNSDKNDDFEMLSRIKQKNKVRLFLNSFCAYDCKSKICYPSISKHNKGQDITPHCVRQFKNIKNPKPMIFDMDILSSIGFSKFKVLPMQNV
jgi:hypothetical protein